MPLSKCAVLVRASAAKTAPPADAAVCILEDALTLGDLAAGMDGNLFVHVQLPASESTHSSGAVGCATRERSVSRHVRALLSSSPPVLIRAATTPTSHLDASAVATRLPDLTPHEVELFLVKAQFDDFRRMLQRGSLRECDVAAIKLRMRNIVETSTRHRFAWDEGIVLDGPIRVASSQASTSLLFSIFGSSVSCAKVGPADLIARESSVYAAIHAGMAVPTVPQPSSTFHIPNNHGTMALVMPLYGLTVTDAALAMAPGQSKSRSALATNVGLCCLASIEAFSRAGYAHGDIKPSNLMLGHTGVVSLVDLGTAQPVGALFSESSSYSLGEPAESSVDYDLVCLGSTLAFVAHSITPAQRPSRSELHAHLASIGEPSPATRLALQCLDRSDLSRRSGALLELARALISATRDLPGVLALETVWPAARHADRVC